MNLETVPTLLEEYIMKNVYKQNIQSLNLFYCYKLSKTKLTKVIILRYVM